MTISVFRLPDLGEGLADADVVEWYVAEGEAVALDQPVVALESAKAVVDIPSPVAGRVHRHCAQPGETVATGAPLVEFEVDGGAAVEVSGGVEVAPADSPESGAADVPGSVGGDTPGHREHREHREHLGHREHREHRGHRGHREHLGHPELPEPPEPPELPEPPGHPEPPEPPGYPGYPEPPEHPQHPGHDEPAMPERPLRIHAMPAARAKAIALGIDLASVSGTGPGGRIRVADIERAAARIERGTWEPLRGVRRTMAQRMALSGATVVPVTVTEDADIGEWNEGEDVTVRLIRAVVAGCAASPALNAWLEDDAGRRTLHDAVHVGIAADTGDGLFVPVLRDAGGKDPVALRAEVDRLRTGAAARSLDPQELDGATITLSNFGMHAGRYATPVVMPPQVAILGAGRARDEAVVRDGAVAIRRLVPLSLTFDHRACTGAESSRFLAAVVADLERAA